MKFDENAGNNCFCKSTVIDIDKDIQIKNTPKQPRWSDKMKKFFLGPPGGRSTNPLDDIENGQTPLEQALQPSNKNKKKQILYYFDHGCADFYETFDQPPNLMSDNLAEQTTQHAIQFWAEMFGFINVAMIFFLTFFLQLLK